MGDTPYKEPRGIDKYMEQKITVNLAGNFATLTLNEEKTLIFSKEPTVEDLLNHLNDLYHTTVFSKKSLQEHRISIMYNGQRLDSKAIKKVKLNSADIITIVQPMVGG